ncbi:MAG: S9 family peptidase [Bacteroidetes bacterium]|nr:S9 family peptidase [Bacteroidota bacterium]
MKHLIFALLLAPLSISAQQQMLTVEDAVLRQRTTLAPERLQQLAWNADNSVAFVKVNNGEETLFIDAASGKSLPKAVLTLSELNQKIQSLQVTALGGMKRFPLITWTSPKTFTFHVTRYLVTYDLGSGKAKPQLTPAIPEDAGYSEESPAGGHIAYTLANNLYVIKSGSDGATAVTSDSEKNIVNGSTVHREEFGIEKGIFWSPSGNLLAFYRMDQTMVTDYPIMNIANQPATATMIKYPMAGAASHHVTLGVYNLSTGKTIFIQTGEPKEQYLTNIAWSPDNKSIYIAVLNRDQNHMKLNRYNAETGAFETTLFEEKDTKYVQPLHAMQFVPGNPNQFIWQSERDGANSIYLYGTDGKMIRNLTPATGITPEPLYIVTDVYGFDVKNTTLFFQAAPFGSIVRHIYKTELATGKVTLLSKEDGVHNAVFNKAGTHYIDNFSSVNTPRVQSVNDVKSGAVKTLLRAANPLAAYSACQIRLFTINAADNKTPLWCRMIMPANFDSTKSYPSLVYVYNGPNVQLVTNSWLGGTDMFLYYMAQQGFVVFTVDGRGSENRGKDFEQATFRNLGSAEIDDQEKGVEYLKTKSYINANRLAVYGWSYGGFMTTSLMTRKAGLFKTGVAGGPVIDWSYYEIMYTERYMDTPQQNPEGYKKSNLVENADKLTGKLLMIHGTSDDVVVWQHSLLFTKACVDKKKQLDYFMYPGHLHNVTGIDRVHLLTKIANYIISST